MIYIKNILVPVDFGEPSERAVNYATSFAKQFNGRLIFAHIVTPSNALMYVFPDETNKIDKEHYQSASHRMAELIPVDLQSRNVEMIVKFGKIENELLGIVNDKSIDLVVMGTHGRRNLGRWLIGSVTERMLRKVPVPVLTVSHVDPANEPAHAKDFVLRRILYATDLAEDSKTGLRFAIELARTAEAELTVLHVVDYSNLPYNVGAVAGYVKELLQESQTTLGELVTQEKSEGTKIEALLLEGKPYEKILSVAEDRSMDMIILNMQGKTAVERAFLGSTAERVVRCSHIPVLSIPIVTSVARESGVNQFIETA